MESVLTTTRIKPSRIFFRIEAGIFLVAGAIGVFNINLFIKALIGSKSYQAVETNPLSRGVLTALHPFFQVFLLLAMVLGVTMFYVAQAAIDPALKRISFILIFLYVALVLVLLNSSKYLGAGGSKTPFTIFLILLFITLLLGHASEIIGIIKRRVVRKYQRSRS